MGMVLGPFFKEEAAKVWRVWTCVGAMAAIQEADKVRTIFDATIIGVNDNIRSHSVLLPPPPSHPAKPNSQSNSK